MSVVCICCNTNSRICTPLSRFVSLGRNSRFVSLLWLAPLLLTSSDECTVSRGRTADGRVKFECVFQVRSSGVSKVRCRLAAPPYHQLSPASVRRFVALEELSFNETRREKIQSSFDACHLHGSLSVSFLVESADQIRRLFSCPLQLHLRLLSLHQRRMPPSFF